MSKIHCFLFLLAFLAACKSGQYASAPKPLESYVAEPEVPLVSTLTIPVNISEAELLHSLNARLTGPLYEDYSFTDNGNDGLMLKVVRSQDLTLFLSGNTLKYRVPLKLWMKKDLLVTAAEAEGELALNMKTTFTIREDWSLVTSTVVEYHEWITRPVLKTGLGNLGVEALANLALNRSKSVLTQSIDRFVGQQISLRPYVEEAWSALQEPVLLDSVYRMWVKTTPTSIGMTPLFTYGGSIQARIAVECLTDVTFGEKPLFRENTHLPALRIIDYAPEDYTVRVATTVPFAEAERLAKSSLIGQVFSAGKKRVKIEDIQLWGNNDKVVVNSKLSGSFNGNIYFIGRPEYNAQKNQIEVADLDYQVDTRNFLFRTAAWLFQGTIKNQMKAAMTFPLDEDIRALRSTVQESLTNYVIQPGITLNGSVDSLTVENTRVTPTGIRVNLFSKGKVNVEVKGL
ncbi:MAG: DUF4403 family protein [Saprospiraceae bacterium]